MNVQDRTSERSAPASTTPRIASANAIAADLQAHPIGGTISAEVLDGFIAWRVWTILGWDDIRQRYRRSVLGPFWITLSMAVFILLLGVIYSRLFHTDIATYIPFLSAGLPLWGFISQTTNESCMAFHEGGRLMKQIKLPYSVYILRVVWRNVIIFLHTIVIFVPVAIVFKVAPNLTTLLVLPALLLVCVNVIWLGTILAILSTRYRDMQPIVGTAVQIMMFVTPIMWPVKSLNGDLYIAQINPVYHMIDLVRAPMLGTAPDLLSWLIVGGLAIVGSALAIALLVSKSRRIVFWV
jgi:ABC-type polysaccharide/polyol phosphate export permease